MIRGIHPVQLTVPAGAEEEARRFYCGVLGLREIDKPASLAGRGGLWLQAGDRQVHIGVEGGVDRLATKAHVAYEVSDLAGWRARLTSLGIEISEGVPIPGHDRFEFRDPFGNRVEFIEPMQATAQPDQVIGPYEERQAACQEYDPRAATAAQRVAALIRSRLPGVLVEHIGSTAVPGCAGKGVVDLMLVYPEGLLGASRQVLEALGFQRQTTRDPFPEDRPMRTGSVVHEGTTFLLHLHVIAASSPEVELLRCFRDRLRADPALVSSYVAAKKAILASEVTDTVDYADKKGEFVQQALRQIGPCTASGACGGGPHETV